MRAWAQVLLPLCVLLVAGCGWPLEPLSPRLDGPWSGETALDGMSYVVRMQLETARETSRVTFDMTGRGTFVVDDTEIPFQVRGYYGHVTTWSFDLTLDVPDGEAYGFQGVIPADDLLQGTLSRLLQGSSAYLLMTPPK